jgi:serine/threonine protein kinase
LFIVSSENILISNDGVLKLCDFGLSRGIVFDDAPADSIPSLSALMDEYKSAQNATAESSPLGSAIASSPGRLDRQASQYVDENIVSLVKCSI